VQNMLRECRDCGTSRKMLRKCFVQRLLNPTFSPQLGGHCFTIMMGLLCLYQDSRPSHSGISSKRIHISTTSFCHLRGRDSSFYHYRRYNTPRRTPSVWMLNTLGAKICDFRPKVPNILQTVRDMPMVTNRKS